MVRASNSKFETGSGERTARVFVSSTFRDMQEERDLLAKQVFPELRRRCRERGVEFIGLDLRWGITLEQEARGEVLPVCLDEIHRCRPYFVGLLGERYGSTVSKLNAELLARHPWLKGLIGRSITELEIRYAFRAAKTPARRAFFYFRDPAYAVQPRRGYRAGFVERDKDLVLKLGALKDAIRAGGFPLREDYADPATGAAFILEDLWKAISADFPARPPLPPLEQERAEHEAFAAARRVSYVARKSDLKRLDEHALGSGAPLILAGEAGSGKSALLANWISGFSKAHPAMPVITHFTGASPHAADPLLLLRRILAELSAVAGTDEAEPEQWHQMADVLPTRLAQAAAKGPIVLVLDGLDQMEDRNNAPDLGWLPHHIPPSVRLVVSTLRGRCFTALEQRAWPVFELAELSPARRKQIVTRYLRRQGKRLDDNQIGRIIAQPQTANALFLKVLMEELLVFGYFNRLNARIRHYVQAKGTVELYGLALQRMEDDCDGPRRGLVRDALSLIWASRRGISETELLVCLEKRGKPLPPAFWSPLRLALGEGLIERAGRLGFFQDHLRQAVESRYCRTAAARARAHRKLADYFEQQPPGERRLDELPTQLERAGEWTRLRDCLTLPEVFEPFMEDRRIHELNAHWEALEKHLDAAHAFHVALTRQSRESPTPDRQLHFLQEIARFFHHRGCFEEAEPYFRQAADMAAGLEDQHALLRGEFLRHFGTYLRDSGQVAEAETVLESAVATLEKAVGEEFPLTAATLSLLAETRRQQGNYRQAEADYIRSLTLVETALGTSHPHAATIRNGLAGVLLEIGNFAAAEENYRRACDIAERSLGPSHPHTANILNNLASTLVHQSRAAEAEPLHCRALGILKEAMGPDHPYTLTSQSTFCYVLQHLGRNDEAEAIARDVHGRRERVHGLQHSETAQSAAYLAELLTTRGAYAEAERLYQQALPVFESQHGATHRLTADCLNGLAGLYHQQGRRTEAEPYYRRVVQAFETCLGGGNLRTENARCNLAILLMDRGELGEAGEVYAKCMAGLEQSGNTQHSVYASCVNGYGILLRKQGRFAEAEGQIERALRFYEQALGADHPQTAVGLKTLAELRREQGRLDEAESLLCQSLAVLEKVYGPDHTLTRRIAGEPLEALRRERSRERAAPPRADRESQPGGDGTFNRS